MKMEENEKTLNDLVNLARTNRALGWEGEDSLADPKSDLTHIIYEKNLYYLVRAEEVEDHKLRDHQYWLIGQCIEKYPQKVNELAEILKENLDKRTSNQS